MSDDLTIIRTLLERQAAKTDAIEAKVDAHRAEGDRRGLEQAAGLEAVRVEVQRLNSRMTDAEHDIRELRDVDGDVRRHQSETDLAHEAALGGAIAHVRTVDAQLAEVKEDVGEVKAETQRAARVDQAICAELGLDYEQVSSSEDGPHLKPKKTTLAKLATENKSSVAAGVVSTVLLLVQIVWKLLEHR